MTEGGQRLTDDERERVRSFLLYLVERSGRSWDEVMYLAGVPSTTAAGWRYKRATPHAAALVEVMRVTGVLDSDYKLLG